MTDQTISTIDPTDATTPEPAPGQPEPLASQPDGRGHRLSEQCWRLGSRARSIDDWRAAVEAGRAATAALPEAPEPRFNLAVALTGLAAAGEPSARTEAADAFEAGRALAESPLLVRYLTTAVALLEKRSAAFDQEPAYHYALGIHLAALGKAVRARRALATAMADSALAERAGAALAEVPEPVVVRAPTVGRNDPCPCGSGKKYKRCHGAG